MRGRMFQPVIGRIEAIRPLALAPIGSIDLGRIMSSLWRGKRVIALAASGALIAALLFALTARPQYTTTTQLLIDPAGLRVVENELTPTNPAQDATVLQVERQVHVLTSDSVLRRVIASEHLDRDPEFARGPSVLRVLAHEILATIGLDRASVTDDATLSALNTQQRHVRVRR